MAINTPRVIVRNHVKTTLEGIGPANDYGTDVKIVEIQRRTLQDWKRSELPAIIVVPGDEDAYRDETLGQNQANRHFRAWNMALVLLLDDTGTSVDTLRDVGEAFVADVEHRLITSRFANNGMPSDIRIGKLTSNEFELIENKLFGFEMNIIVRYDHRVEDLIP